MQHAPKPQHEQKPPDGYKHVNSIKSGSKTKHTFRQNTSGKQIELKVGSDGEVIQTKVKNSNEGHSETVLSKLPKGDKGAKLRKLFAGQSTDESHNSHSKLKKQFEPQTAVANGSSGPAKKAEGAVKNAEQSTPNKVHMSESVPVPVQAVMRQVVAVTGIAKKVPKPTAQEVKNAILHTQAQLPSAAAIVHKPPVLPISIEVSSNAEQIAKSVSVQLNPLSAIPFRQVFNGTPNGAARKIAYAQQGFSNPLYGISSTRAQQGFSNSIYDTVDTRAQQGISNTLYGISSTRAQQGFSNPLYGISSTRAQQGFSNSIYGTVNFSNGKPLQSLPAVKQVNKYNRLSSRQQATPAAVVNPINTYSHLTPLARQTGTSATIQQSSESATQAQSLQSHSNKNFSQTQRAEQAQQAQKQPAKSNQSTEQSTPAQKQAMSAFNNLPFKNMENLVNLANLAHKSGMGFEQPNLTGIAATHAPKRVGKKTMKKILFNTEQKKILERKIRKAEEKAKRGPSFLSKVLGGFGFYPSDGRNAQQHIADLQGKIQKLDQSIATSQERLEKKRGIAQNNATRKNLNAKQKAINRTKHYRDLMSQYLTGNSTGEIEVPHHQNNTKTITEKQNARKAKKLTKTNILNITNPTNKRAHGLDENMRTLFNNTQLPKTPGLGNTLLPKTPGLGNTLRNLGSLKTSSLLNTPGVGNILLPKTPGLGNEPLVPKINLAAKNTKRKAAANAMAGKNPYELLGLDPTKLRSEDFNSTVKETFDKLLRAKKPKNLTPENNAKLAELRQARDFLLNTNLRIGFNSRTVKKINPNTILRSNSAQLLAEQRKEPSATQFTSGESTPIGKGQSFGNQIKQNTAKTPDARNAANALLFG